MKQQSIAALVAFGMTSVAHMTPAQAASLGYIDGYYIPSAELEISDAGISGEDDGDGFGVKGRARFADQLFFTGEYQAVEYDDSELELDQLRAGVGFSSAVSPELNLIGRAEFVQVEVDSPFQDSEDETGYGVHAGAEAMLAPQFMAHGSVGYISVDDADGPEFLAGLRFLANESISIFADYRVTRLSDSGSDLDLDDLRIGAGFSF